MGERRRCRFVLEPVEIGILLSACAVPPASPRAAPPPAPRTGPTVIAEEDATEWNYVALGDSTVFTPSQAAMIVQYAEMLQDDLAIEVTLKSHASGHGGASGLIERLRSSEALREDLRNADVVTLQIPTHDLEPSCRLYDSEPESCGGEDHQDCLREAFNQYKRDTETVFAEVTALCDPTEVLIRAQDTYLFNATHLKETGKLDVYNRYWRDAQEHVHIVAEQYDIPVAHVYDEFMGPDGTDDPAEKGWIGDITHANERGAEVMARLMRDLGYGYAPAGP